MLPFENQLWLDVAEARELIGVGESTMRLLIRSRVFRACQLKVPGKSWGKWLVNKESLLTYLDKQARKYDRERQQHPATVGAAVA